MDRAELERLDDEGIGSWDRHDADAFVNLLENAARHSPPGRTVEIGARPLGDEIEMWVSDEGPGVDLEHRDQLFEPFRRGPGSQSSGTISP